MHSILYITILIYVLSCQHISTHTGARPKPPPLRLQCPITLGNPTEVIFQDISGKKNSLKNVLVIDKQPPAWQEANNHPCLSHCHQQFHRVMKPIPHFAGSLQLEGKNQRVLIILKVKPRRILELKQGRKAEFLEFIILSHLIVFLIQCSLRCMKHYCTSEDQSEFKCRKIMSK